MKPLAHLGMDSKMGPDLLNSAVIIFTNISHAVEKSRPSVSDGSPDLRR